MNDAFCQDFPQDTLCTIPVTLDKPVKGLSSDVPNHVFMGTGGYACLALLTVFACGHLFNWLGRRRYALSWHDMTDIQRIERLRNGVYGQIPWHPPHARVNKVPIFGPIDERMSPNTVSSLAEQWANEGPPVTAPKVTGGLVSPGLEPPEANTGGEGGELLSAEEINIIHTMVYGGGEASSLNKISECLEVAKNSKKYHAIREIRAKMVDNRGKAELAAKATK